MEMISLLLQTSPEFISIATLVANLIQINAKEMDYVE